ncbi:uncharacterized protein BDZ99DRAFT_513404 [Mytilinidion resinicola]|uniref:Uncharacterized protein n=1 Tax=Mytilinidion resinicola TaxID=574789 RepID=A0A6A6Z8W5_9PEZI|nr:uncharacterized protein BDZ99DRAFT_513404 [Mytilinidion resinicola]KAF2817149.1 hypothetical protein BDZ99DRAFT_513404 [Mytilinidion resinicola]
MEHYDKLHEDSNARMTAMTAMTTTKTSSREHHILKPTASFNHHLNQPTSSSINFTSSSSSTLQTTQAVFSIPLPNLTTDFKMVATNNTSFETVRTSSVPSNKAGNNSAKKAFSSVAKHLKEHHQSVNNAFASYYGLQGQMHPQN